jgi:hypothetical protein
MFHSADSRRTTTIKSPGTTQSLFNGGHTKLRGKLIIDASEEQMPRNTFHSLRRILGCRQQVEPEIAVRALMATVFTECCHDCNEKMRDKDFLKAFEHMVDELIHVQRLSRVA